MQRFKKLAFIRWVPYIIVLKTQSRMQLWFPSSHIFRFFERQHKKSFRWRMRSQTQLENFSKVCKTLTTWLNGWRSLRSGRNWLGGGPSHLRKNGLSARRSKLGHCSTCRSASTISRSSRGQLRQHPSCPSWTKLSKLPTEKQSRTRQSEYKYSNYCILFHY